MISQSQNDHVPTKILVFLPVQAAARIASMLTENGFAPTAISSAPDLSRALLSASYCAVVTTRSKIDAVRAIEPLPVINLEVFFHGGADEGFGTAGKHFDPAAFLARLAMLTKLSSAKAGRSFPHPVPSKRGRLDIMPFASLASRFARALLGRPAGQQG